MALTYDQISAITEKKFIPKMVDNIFNQNALLKKLKAKEKPQSGGDKVIVPLEYAQASAAGWYQGAETVDTTDNEVITATAVTLLRSTLLWEKYRMLKRLFVTP
jgi:hypothetical protein